MRDDEKKSLIHWFSTQSLSYCSVLVIVIYHWTRQGKFLPQWNWYYSSAVRYHRSNTPWRHETMKTLNKWCHRKTARVISGWGGRGLPLWGWHLRGELRPATAIFGQGCSEQEGGTYSKAWSEKDGRWDQWGFRVVKEKEAGVEPGRKLRRSRGLWRLL